MSTNPAPPPDIEQLKQALQKAPILRALMEVAPEVVQTALRSEFYKSNTVLFREGEPADRVFAIWSGRLRVQHDIGIDQPLVLRDCFPGDVVGEISLLDNQPRSATVLVVEDSRLISLSREDFQRIIASKPEVTFDLLRALGHRLRSSSDLLVATSRSVEMIAHRIGIAHPAGMAGGPSAPTGTDALWSGISDLLGEFAESAGTIATAAGQIREHLPEHALDDTGLDLLDVLSANPAYLQRLLERARDLAALLSGPVSLQRSAVMVAGMIDMLASRLNPMARTRDVIFDLKVAHNLPMVMGDGDLLRMALWYLMEFQMWRAPAGGTIKVVVDHRFEREVHATIIEPLADPLSREQLAALFEPFAAPLSEDSLWTGLELAASRAALRAHHGDVAAAVGEDGRGLIFSVTVPTSGSGG